MHIAPEFDDLEEGLTEKYLGKNMNSGNMTHCERFLFSIQFVILFFLICGIIVCILKVEHII